jgi:hypothetical protein
MKYSVSATFEIEGNNAQDAQDRLTEMLKNAKVDPLAVHSASGDTSVKPRLSERLQTFLDAEIQNNDDDTSGHTTDLDYVKGSLEQMPDDVLIEQCDYDGDLSPAEFAGHLNAEFDVLYAKYGGGTIVADLLPD